MVIFCPSDVHQLSMSDGCKYDVSRPKNRTAAPGFGVPTRSCGRIETTCPDCIHWFTTEPNSRDYSQRIDSVSLSADEMDYQRGKQQAAATTIESLRAALDALELQ